MIPSRWPPGYNTKDGIKYNKTRTESQEDNSFQADDHEAITALSITRYKRIEDNSFPADDHQAITPRTALSIS